MKFTGINLIILAQSAIFSIATLHPITNAIALVILGGELVIAAICELEFRRRGESNSPLLMALMALALTLIVGGSW